MTRETRYFDLPSTPGSAARTRTFRTLEAFRIFGVRAVKLRLAEGDSLSPSEWLAVAHLERVLNTRQIRLEVQGA